MLLDLVEYILQNYSTRFNLWGTEFKLLKENSNIMYQKVENSLKSVLSKIPLFKLLISQRICKNI